MRFLRPQVRHVAALLMVLGVVAGVWQTAQALSAGATPDKSNNPRAVGGVPKPAETCSKSGCHDTPPASCTGKVEILGLPGCYVAGQTYNLSIKVTDPNARRWGFEVGAQYSEGNNNDYLSAGTIANDPAGRTQQVTSADGLRKFITHDKASANGDGTFPAQAGNATWPFKWTAPGGTDRQTKVCFYVAGLAGDNDNTADNDCTYNTTVCVNPCGPVSTHRSTWGDLKIHYQK